MSSAAHPPWVCGAFVASTTVVILMVFETLFFLLFVGPKVEGGNVKLNAAAVAEGIVEQMGQGMECEEVEQRITSGMNAFPLPPKQHNSNNTALTNVALISGGLVISLIGWWFLYLRGRIEFPGKALAREALPLLTAFALYDFAYFQFFVRTWNTGSADEFLYSMSKELLHPPTS